VLTSPPVNALSATKPKRRHRTWRAQLLYLRALLRRFRFTFISLFTLIVGGGTLIWWLQARAGAPVSWGRGLITAYFLLFAQTVGDVPDNGLLEAVYAIIPPLGILSVAQGLVRFAFLFFAKQRDDKEWFAVLAQTMKDHVVVCGAGRVGFRIFQQYQRLEIPMVVIERKADAPFLPAIRAAGVPVLVADVRSSSALEQSNLAEARAIVCATDDDLANLNIALDARRLKPGIRVVIRLFDDDLVAKTREAFQFEAFSTSAHSAPALAVAALDPSILNSFEMGGRLLVVAEIVAGVELAGLTVEELKTKHQLAVLQLSDASGAQRFDPPAGMQIVAGEKIAMQGTLQAWQTFREKLDARLAARVSDLMSQMRPAR